jgi:hypothetical protein
MCVHVGVVPYCQVAVGQHGSLEVALSGIGYSGHQQSVSGG